MTQPPCRGSKAPCPIKSGLQTLRLRRNGFVSLSTGGDGSMKSAGVIATEPFVLPSCPAGKPLTLHLNIFTSIGRGAFVELSTLATETSSGQVRSVRSTQILGGVDVVAEWMKPPPNSQAKTQKVWLNGGCAYEAHNRNESLPNGSCDQGNYHRSCNVTSDCDCYVDPGSSTVHCDKIPGTCKGVHSQCVSGICQAPNVTGGAACGQWKELVTKPPAVSIGSDLSKAFGAKEEVVMKISMWASDLYSVQFVCGDANEDQNA